MTRLRTVLAWTYLINLGHNLVLAALALTGVIDFWMILVLSVVNGVKQLLPKIAATLPTSLRITQLFDQSVFVRASVSGVVREALIAAFLTAMMILLFLGSWRSTLIVCLSIPLSILTSIIILGLLGGILGGWIFGQLGIWSGGGMIGSIIVAFVGAVILVWITRLLKKA